MKKLLVLLFVIINLIDTIAQDYTPEFTAFHAAQTTGRTGMPAAMVFLNGQYHVYCLSNEISDGLHFRSWGHLVSKDLINWQTLPLAMSDASATMGPGSCLIDKNNSSGLFATADPNNLIAYYSLNNVIEIVISTDGGNSFMPSSKAIVSGILPLQTDPYIFYHTLSSRWCLVLSAPDERKIYFYNSTDLQHWNATGSFGTAGNKMGKWYRPCLVELKVDAGIEKQWLLSVSGHGPIEGYPGVQYFIGAFDGKNFTNKNAVDFELYMDYGKDFYGASFFSNQTTKTISMAWMNSSSYASREPISTWNGTLTLPRELMFVTTSEGLRLSQKPIAEIGKLRKVCKSFSDLKADSIEKLIDTLTFKGKLFEVRASVILNRKSEEIAFLMRRSGKSAISVGFNSIERLLFVDRTWSGNLSFSSNFSSFEVAPYSFGADSLAFRIIIDKGQVEIFSGDGTVTLSEIFYPATNATGFKFSAIGPIYVQKLDICKLE